MDFIQNFRFSALLERFNYWDQRENRVAFFNNFPLPEDHGPTLRAMPNIFIVAPWYDGYEEFFGNSLKYHELTTGKVFLIRPHTNDTSYECYQDLYNKSVESNNFRVIQPVYREVVNGFEYIEFNSLNSEAGTNTSSLFLYQSHDVQNIRDYIDETAHIIRAAKSIAITRAVGFPENVCLILNRYKDSQGYFYTECLDWNSTFEVFVDANIELLQTLSTVTVSLGFITEAEQASAITYARTTWTQA
jgi:hypothetical protein